MNLAIDQLDREIQQLQAQRAAELSHRDPLMLNRDLALKSRNTLKNKNAPVAPNLIEPSTPQNVRDRPRVCYNPARGSVEGRPHSDGASRPYNGRQIVVAFAPAGLST